LPFVLSLSKHDSRHEQVRKVLKASFDSLRTGFDRLRANGLTREIADH
jgi:hypothetical protein